MTPDALRGLVQPDQRTCGPSSLVAAHLLLDPAYAATQDPASFGPAVVALHRLLTAPSFDGRAQLPWPRALGTPPWAVARAMTSFSGRSYRTRVVRWGDRGNDLGRLTAAAADGLPCPVYVGDRIPRHVVLCVGTTQAGLRVYNPARGSLDELTAASFRSGRLTVFGRWTRPWFVVAP